MKYSITTIVNSDYCQLANNDIECRRTQIIDADSKAEAVFKLHQSTGFIQNNLHSHEILPMVWEIKQI